MDSDTNTQSCSETDNTAEKKSRQYTRDAVSGKFASKIKRKKSGELTIEELLRPLPEQMDELEIVPTAQSVAFAVEWLEDIDLIRGRSYYQGVMSKRMRDRITAVKKVIRTLSVKMEEKGDFAYYKRKNVELQAQLAASQKEVEKMNHRINDLQHTVEELRRIIVSGADLPCEDKATSPMEVSQERKNRGSWTKENVQGKGKGKDVVFRPPLQGGIHAYFGVRAKHYRE